MVACALEHDAVKLESTWLERQNALVLTEAVSDTLIRKQRARGSVRLERLHTEITLIPFSDK